MPVDHTSLASQGDSPAPSQSRLTDRQAQEDSSHPRAQALAAPTSIPVCTALHLRQQTSYLYLSGKGASRSLQASPCFLLLATL